MRAGDRVRYNAAHWKWMVDAGRALPRHERRVRVGTVLEADEATVLVEWDAGKPWPFVSRAEPATTGPTTQLPDNLEVVR